MSDANSTNPNEKVAKIRRKPERDSVLTPTFAATRQTTLDRHQGQPSGGSLLQRQCSCGKHTIAGSGCEECQKKGETASQNALDELNPATPPDIQTTRDGTASFNLSHIPVQTRFTANGQPLQPALTVNAPGDQYEQEADRVAETVMRMPAPPPPSPSTEVDSFSHPTVSRLPANSPVQTSGDNGAFQAPSKVEARINQMQNGGQALPAEEQDFFEERMGYDFSHVRIHTDANAVQASRDIQAQAFTMGNNIAFNEGAYQPGTQIGRYLLAHELTHVVQQGAAQVQRKPTLSRLIGSTKKSQVLNHLQTLQQQPNFDASLYRKEIAGFQQANSADNIVAHQERILEAQEPMDIRERTDRSRVLRICGGCSSCSSPPPAPSFTRGQTLGVDPKNTEGWIQGRLGTGSSDRVVSFPEYLKVEYEERRSNRDYFVIREGPYDGQTASLKPGYLDTKTWGGSASVTFFEDSGKSTTYHSEGEVDYGAGRVPAKIYVDPDTSKISLNRNYPLQLPDAPHAGGASYGDYAKTWFRIEGGPQGDEYLHRGRFSAGCVTVLENWSNVYQNLINKRSDNQHIGSIKRVIK